MLALLLVDNGLCFKVLRLILWFSLCAGLSMNASESSASLFCLPGARAGSCAVPFLLPGTGFGPLGRGC